MKKLISIVAGCYNEEENIRELYSRWCKVSVQYSQYDFEFVLIDNASEDKSFDIIKELAANDSRLKGYRNTRNFGHIRSPYYAFLKAQGDAVVGMASDLEDPPELIGSFIEKWEQGYKVALGVREGSDETGIMPHLRDLYYTLITKASETEQIRNFTGFGLYDKEVMDQFRYMDDPYPYFRGTIADLGYKYATIAFTKPVRSGGVSKGNVFVYIDSALLGLVNHSKIPLRAATFLGIMLGILSLGAASYVFVTKLLYWDNYQLGLAPLSIGVFLLFSVLFVLIGLLGEYISLIMTHVIKKPRVVIEETVNIDDEF